MELVNKESLKKTISFINQLTHGIDPIYNSDISGDSLLSNREYRKQLIYIEQALNFLYQNLHGNSFRVYERKASFQLTIDQINEIGIPDEPISVSKLAYNINAIANTEDMKKIKATQITDWLEKMGYLKDNYEENSSRKVCTEKASEIGIFEIEKVNEYGIKYKVNVYSKKAQAYVINNVNSIVNI